MNKHITSVVLSSILCISSLGVAQTHSANLTRNVACATQKHLAEVNVTLDWAREIKMEDVMVRPARGGARKSNVVLNKQTKQTTCKGILTHKGQVVIPTVCTDQGDWQLTKLTLVFANGKKGVGPAETLRIKDEVAYIKVNVELTKGLIGLPTLTTPKGKSLEEHFGHSILNTLSSFFRSKGVVISKRYLRPGKVHYADSTLQVGDGVLYQGKLVALVKKDVHHLRSISESPLAILR